jgi:hypothetical protein
MRTSFVALLLCAAVSTMSALAAEEPPAEQIELKDGSTLYLHPDGTSRMIDVHGKRMNMRDGVEMETADGRIILMQNKKVWVQVGTPGKHVGPVQKVD